MTVSVVVPVLNDAEALGRLLADLRPVRNASLEIVVVDGGSADGSVDVAADADMVLAAAPGRGGQLRLGAEHARGEWLWFVHADTRVDAGVVAELRDSLGRPAWGFCRVRLDGGRWPLRLVETAMNWRSRASGIGTGDQGIFVHRRLLDQIGGVPPLPLMEDIECCRRLRLLARPRRIATPITTSARRWAQAGVARTILRMWWYRLCYWAGADAAGLAARYYR